MFLGFVYQGTTYQFWALLSGLKLVNHIVQVVSELGIFMLANLDSQLITTTVCKAHLQTVLCVGL